ncbi:MAG: riboflavin synthase [Rudaea sp.]
MFTGIVQATGRVMAAQAIGDASRIGIDAGALDLSDVRIGDSIAVSGCCLTVVRVAAPRLDFDVSAETMRCTKGFAMGDRVNLEKALRLADRLGGHLMSGHVDGVGTVVACAEVVGGGGNRLLEVEAPAALARYVAAKGSIAIDGASLTTNAVAGTRFTVNLIPHTLAVTTLGTIEAGARVNLEIDLIARYVERLRAPEPPA